jgi:hypothetical protein
MKKPGSNVFDESHAPDHTSNGSSTSSSAIRRGSRAAAVRDRTAAADDAHRVALEDRQLPRDGRHAVRLVLRTRVDMYLRSLPGPRGSLSRERRAHLSETYCRCHKHCRIDDTARVRGDRRIEAG